MEDVQDTKLGKAILFPGHIKTSASRPLSTIIPEWIDSENNLCLTSSVRIAPTEEASSKLVFRKTKNADGSVTTKFLGITKKEIRYIQMADFVYSPPSDGEKTHIVGPSISKQTTPVLFNYESNPSMSILEAREAAAVKDEENGEVAFLRFKDKRAAPSQPTSLSLQKAEDDPSSVGDLVSRISELFMKRPVWQRASLEEALGEENTVSPWKLANALRQVSYLFLDGPWRKCYVRFGYDPRIDSSSRTLQMIDFRDPYLRNEDNRQANAGDKPDIHFRKAPVNRSQLYQMCDIEDPGIHALLSGPCRMMAADPHTGWLTEYEMESIRNQMKIKSESMRRSSGFIYS